jgi:hypothetical protein
LKVARRFDDLGDLAGIWREFAQEFEEILAEADRRIAAEPNATRALRDARERCYRNAGGFLRSYRDSGARPPVEEWGLLASAIHWVEDLEAQLSRDAVRTLRTDGPTDR